MANDSPANVERTDALIDAALAVHGGRLDDAQRAVLRQHAERLRTLAAHLDGHPLANADEPDFSFRAIDRVDAV